jgi:hypothetical protein
MKESPMDRPNSELPPKGRVRRVRSAWLALLAIVLVAAMSAAGCGGEIPVCEGTACNIVQLAAAGRSTCALFEDGVLACWGDNAFGTLGRPTPFALANRSPVFVPGPRFDTISLGLAHGCGISEGLVYCWGNDEYGQLGDGTRSNGSFEPVVVPGLAGMIKVASADELSPTDSNALATGGSCAFSPTDGVFCWGFGVATPRRIEGTQLPYATHLVVGGTAGAEYGCLLNSGTLSCWWMGDTRVSVALTDVQSVTSNGSMWCATGRAEVRCGTGRPGVAGSWGVGSSGIGFASPVATCVASADVARCTSTVVSTEAQVLAGAVGRRTVEGRVAVGQSHACLIVGEATVVCSGANELGQTAQLSDLTSAWSPVSFE